VSDTVLGTEANNTGMSFMFRWGEEVENKKIAERVVHTYNPSTWEPETGGCVFKATLGYIVRP
jgi:hypothetical protein